MNVKTLISQLQSFAGQARFVSFTYTDKKHGETARRVLIIGADYQKIVADSLLELQLIRKTETLSPLQIQAADELENSFRKTLNGTQDGYTKDGQYVIVANGVKLNRNDNTLELFGLEHSKVILEKGVYKKVKHRPLTIAKNGLDDRLSRSRYRTLSLDADNMVEAKLNGETIELA